MKDTLKRRMWWRVCDSLSALQTASRPRLAYLKQPAKRCHFTHHRQVCHSAWQPDPFDVANQLSHRYAVPERLAAVVLLTATVVSIATQQQKVPISGRSQLLLPWVVRQLANMSPQGVQQISTLKEDTAFTQAKTMHLHQQGLQLMRRLYQQATNGAEYLAHSDQELQQRMQLLPKNIVLQHIVRAVEPQTLTRGIPDESGPKMEISMTAGVLLQNASSRSGTWVMARELAHGIAMHDAESGSWSFLLATTLLAVLLLAGVTWWLAAGISLLVTVLLGGPATYALLSRTHSYEADLLGLAIAEAASCTLSDAVVALTEGAILCKPSSYAQLVGGESFKLSHGALSSLRSLMPSVALPNKVDDDKSFKAVIGAVIGAVESQQLESDQLARNIGSLLAFIVVELGFFVYEFRNPLERQLSLVPQWLDRIAKLKARPDISGTSTAAISDDLQSDLRSYQALYELEQVDKNPWSPTWPLSDWDKDDDMSWLQQSSTARELSTTDLLSYAAEQDTKQYGFAFSLAAVLGTVFRVALPFWWVPILVFVAPWVAKVSNLSFGESLRFVLPGNM